MKQILHAFAVGAAISAATTALALSLGWMAPDHWYEAIVAAVAYAVTYLSIIGRRVFYLIGIVCVLAYAIVYATAGLPASALLQLTLAVIYAFGYRSWGKSLRPVTRLRPEHAPAYLAAAGALFAAVWGACALLGATPPVGDAVVFAIVILVQLLLARRVLAAWHIWTLANTLGAVLYFTAGLPVAAMQQAIFIAANFWGNHAWKREMTPATAAHS